MHINLPPAIVSKSQLDGLVEEVRLNKKSEQLDAFKKSNEALFTQNLTTSEITNGLQSLTEPGNIVVCTLAQQPDNDFLNELIAWFRQNIKSTLVLEVQIDPFIIGGILIRTPQRMYDWTWQEVLTQTKPKLINMVRHGS
jgi:hypothetical protein